MHLVLPDNQHYFDHIIYMPSCGSTNTECVAWLAKNETAKGVVIATGYQTNGRGQRGNVWLAEPDLNIMLSIGLRPKNVLAKNQFYLNMAVCLAIYHVFEQLGLNNLAIKWPNDIFVNNKKLGGILIENHILGGNISQSIIGVGLNILQKKMEYKQATSLICEVPEMVDINIEKLIASLLKSVVKYLEILEAEQFDVLKNAYTKKLFRINEWAAFKKNGIIFNGKIVGVNALGQLIIQTETTVEVFDFKEIEYVY